MDLLLRKANNFVDVLFDSDDDEKKKKKKKKPNKSKKDKSKIAASDDTTKRDSTKKKEKDDDDDDMLDLAGDIAADVATGGIYGLVTSSVEAVEGMQKASKVKKDTTGTGRLTVKETAGIMAGAFTFGMLGTDPDDKEQIKQKKTDS